jgi:hypothetical protein
MVVDGALLINRKNKIYLLRHCIVTNCDAELATKRLFDADFARQLARSRPSLRDKADRLTLLFAIRNSAVTISVFGLESNVYFEIDLAIDRVFSLIRFD